jgi:peptidoglycan DL-endopeptidase CwlO
LASKKTLGGLALVAGLVAWAVSSAPRELPEAAPLPVEPAVPPAPPAPTVRPRSFRRRLAVSFAFAVMFFAGAALAAGAGNVLVANDGAVAEAPTDVTTTDDATTTTEDVAAATTDDVVPTTDEVATTAAAEAAEAATTTDEVTTTDEATTTEDAAPVETNDALLPEPAPAPAATAPGPAAPRHAVVRAQRRVTAPASAPSAPAPVPPFPVVAFDPQVWLADNPGTPVGNAVVSIAEHYLGVPYRWGGNSPSTGFDCSGLTQYVYAQLGIWLPHYAAAQFLAYPRLDPSQLEPGDLVFFEPKADGPGHTAIYAGNGQIIEAPHTGATVRVGSLAGAAAALGFLGAVRPTTTPVARALAWRAPTAEPGTWFIAS